MIFVDFEILRIIDLPINIMYINKFINIKIIAFWILCVISIIRFVVTEFVCRSYYKVSLYSHIKSVSVAKGKCLQMTCITFK